MCQGSFVYHTFLQFKSNKEKSADSAEDELVESFLYKFTFITYSSSIFIVYFCKILLKNKKNVQDFLLI